MSRKRSKHHSVEQIVKKLRDAETMLGAGKTEVCSLLMAFRNIFVPTMGRILLRPAFASGSVTRVLGRCLFRRAVHGRTVMQKVSIVG